MRECESRQQNNMEVDRDEGMEDLSFVPNAVSDMAGWHKVRFMCDKRCMKEGFKLFDMTAI